MLTIPSGQAAHDAWNGLAPDVRSSLIAQARRYESPADPALAAVLLGRLRSGAGVRWYQRAATLAGAVVLGGAVAAWIGEPGSRGLLGLVGAGAAGAILAGSAMSLPEGYALRRAEVATLRAFLASPDAAGAPPATRSWTWAAVVVGTVVVAAGIPLAAFGLIRMLGIGFDWATFGRNAALIVGGCLALNAVIRAGSWLDPRRDRAHRVSVGDGGVRFGLRRRVAWSDIADVTLAGPTAAEPDEDKAMVWTLRDGSTIRVALTDRTSRPEELILAARTHAAR